MAHCFSLADRLWQGHTKSTERVAKHSRRTKNQLQTMAVSDSVVESQSRKINTQQSHDFGTATIR